MNGIAEVELVVWSCGSAGNSKFGSWFAAAARTAGKTLDIVVEVVQAEIVVAEDEIVVSAAEVAVEAGRTADIVEVDEKFVGTVEGNVADNSAVGSDVILVETVAEVLDKVELASFVVAVDWTVQKDVAV